MRKLDVTKTLVALAALAVSGFAAAALAAPSASPTALCKAERADASFAAAHGGKTFADFYGTGKVKKNAFGKCVAMKAKAKKSTTSTATTAAAQTTTTAAKNLRTPAALCRAERADANFAAAHGGKTFVQHYGTNKNQKNAFGKCVAAKAKAKAKSQTPTTTTPTTTTPTTAATPTAPTPTTAQPATLKPVSTCELEQADAGFAAAHAGKSFAQHYGKNAGLQNAFGICVSTKAKSAGS